MTVIVGSPVCTDKSCRHGIELKDRWDESQSYITCETFLFINYLFLLLSADVIELLCFVAV